MDEVMAMEKKKLKLAKRPLRVQRCKARPSVSTPNRTLTHSSPKKPDTRPSRPAKGDPGLGERIRNLSKDERKAAKNADSSRQARRLAKKQMRHGMAKDVGPVKLSASRAEREARTHVVSKPKKRSANAIARMKGQRV